MKIQFLVFSDGPSHKFLGINPVRGLQKLGIETELFWVKYNKGKLIDKPDYVFCLKPRESDDLILDFKRKGSKISLIVNDEYLSEFRVKVYDFAVSPSLKWLSAYNISTYLIKEEFDYCQTKKHQDSFRIVTFGFKENLIHHLTPILPSLENLDLTIVSNFEDFFKLPEIFYKFKLCKFKSLNWEDEKFDETMIRQFEEYDVGLVSQYKDCGRTSNRVKILLYCGLPVITSCSNNYENLWFNKDKIKLHLVDNNWNDNVLKFKKKEQRQEIVDYNFNLIKNNFGIEQSARSFLEAIKCYEKQIYSR